MSIAQPPRLASWLSRRFAGGPQRESLIGDLDEQVAKGRSSFWYWRQVLSAILVGVARDSSRTTAASRTTRGTRWQNPERECRLLRPNLRVRRLAIRELGDSEDPRAQQALIEIVRENLVSR